MMLQDLNGSASHSFVKDVQNLTNNKSSYVRYFVKLLLGRLERITHLQRPYDTTLLGHNLTPTNQTSHKAWLLILFLEMMK